MSGWHAFLAVGILGVLLLGSPIGAAPSTASAPPAGANASRSLQSWSARLEQAWTQLVDARARKKTALAAATRARNRHRAVGERKVALYAEIEASEAALKEAEARWPALLEEARRAGVPPGILRDYEDRH